MTIVDKENNVKMIQAFMGRQKFYCRYCLYVDRKTADIIQSNRKKEGGRKSYSTELVLRSIEEFLDAPYIHTFREFNTSPYRGCSSNAEDRTQVMFSLKMTDEKAVRLFERFVEYVEHIPNIDLLPGNVKPIITMIRIVLYTYVYKHMTLIEKEPPKDTEPHKYIPVEIKNIIKNLRTCTKCSGLYLATNSAQIKILLLKSIREILQDSINNIDLLIGRIAKTMDLLGNKKSK